MIKSIKSGGSTDKCWYSSFLNAMNSAMLNAQTKLWGLIKLFEKGHILVELDIWIPIRLFNPTCSLLNWENIWTILD